MNDPLDGRRVMGDVFGWLEKSIRLIDLLVVNDRSHQIRCHQAHKATFHPSTMTSVLPSSFPSTGSYEVTVAATSPSHTMVLRRTTTS